MTNNLTPSGKLVLEQLGINPNNLRADFLNREQRLQYRAVVQWLTVYKPKPDATNLEKVRGYLEAFHHLCVVEDWERASEVITIRLDTPTNQELHHQLNTWGYYRELVDLYTRILGKLSPSWDAIFLGLGKVDYVLGNYTQALEYYRQSLMIARKIQYRWEEGTALVNLGSVYQSLGEHEKALDYYQQSLQIAEEIGDRAGIGRVLSNLGIIYSEMINGDRMENLEEAIHYYKQSLAIAQEIGDRIGEGSAITNLGKASIKLEQYSEAMEYLQAGLNIYRTIGARFGEATVLSNLAELYQKLGDRTLALEYCDRALSIATELGIPLAKECQELKEKLLNE